MMNIEPSGRVVPVAYHRDRCMPGRLVSCPLSGFSELMSGLPVLVVFAPVQLSPPKINISPVSGPGPINIGNPGEFSIKELAEKVIAQVDSGSKIVYRPLPADDPMQRRPDITQATEVLGWSPTVPLDEGLERTVNYFRGYLAE
jgi:hypothetical protein